MDDEQRRQLQTQVDRVLGPMRADTEMRSAHTAVMRENNEELRQVSDEIKGYTARGEVVPAELLERAASARQKAHLLNPES